MADYVEITTAFKDRRDGTALNDGTVLLVRTPCVLELAGGGHIDPGVESYPIESGQAKNVAAGAAVQFPITEDSNPEGATLSLSLLSPIGHKRHLGEVLVPRPAGSAPYAAITLASILPVGEEE